MTDYSGIEHRRGCACDRCENRRRKAEAIGRLVELIKEMAFSHGYVMDMDTGLMKIPDEMVAGYYDDLDHLAELLKRKRPWS